MVDINNWLDEFLQKLNETFKSRVWFVGLQGSYGRGSVVVRAAGNGDGKTKGAVISLNKKVCARLGSGIRAGCVNGSGLGEEEVGTVEGKIAVNLVGGNLMIALDAVLTASIHHNCGTHDVGVKEYSWVLDRTVNVALSREVNHDIGVLLLKYLVYRFSVGNINLAETEVRIIHNRSKGFKVSCISEAVKAYDSVILMLAEHIVNEVSSDKAGTAGNDYFHNCFSVNDIIYFP